MTVGRPFTRGDSKINRSGRPPGIDSAIRRHVVPNLERLTRVCAEAGLNGDAAAAGVCLLLAVLGKKS